MRARGYCCVTRLNAPHKNEREKLENRKKKAESVLKFGGKREHQERVLFSC